MANEEQLEIFQRGVDEWNEWRENNPDIEVDLSNIRLIRENDIHDVFRVQRIENSFLHVGDLTAANLNHANLSGSDFSEADLEHASFIEANLEKVNLARVNLSEANFAGARLIKANLTGANLYSADFSNANLRGAILDGASLMDAHLNGADLQLAKLRNADMWSVDLREANCYRADLHHSRLNLADLRGAKLSETKLNNTNLDNASLEKAHLLRTNLRYANLTSVNLNNANLRKADLLGANLTSTNLVQANLSGACLLDANLAGAKLVRANLSEADLSHSNLSATDLSEADLSGANLSHANLIQAKIFNTKISKSIVYGVNVWDLEGDFKEQNELRITPAKQPIITVDNIKVAQFVYLILNNKELRDVINALTSKTVLILGRFAIPERKAILDALRNKLREYDLLPIVFDFDRPTDKDFTETIKTLAGISYFVIADVTNPKSSPLELQATVPDYQIPFVPIIQEGEQPFSMMADLHQKYSWVLPTKSYDSIETLMSALKPGIIDPAVEMRNKLRLVKAQEQVTENLKDYLDKSL